MFVRKFLIGATMFVALFVCWGGARALAANPPLLSTFGDPGSAAEQLGGPGEDLGGVAVGPTNAYVYVADSGNQRIAVFTPWGEFVKAVGWDVSTGAIDEEQEVSVRATGGSFTLEFAGSKTGDLAPDASPTDIEAALNALSTIGGAGGTVDVTGGPGGIPGTTPAIYVIRFRGALSATNVGAIVTANGTVPLSGGTPTALSSTTRADGAAAGTGLETCTTASGCKAGSSGAGAGQLIEPTGIAVDAAGDVYVYDRAAFRMQKYSPSGAFLAMWGREVNKTSGEDLCTAADLEASDVCGIGLEGTGDGQFSIQGIGAFYDAVALSPDESTIYVGDKDRIQQFDQSGAFKGQLTFASIKASAPSSTFPESGRSGSIAVDPNSGDVYLAFAQGLGEANKIPGVFRISPSGSLVDTLNVFASAPGTIEGPEVIATDSAGAVYVLERPIIGGFTFPRRVVKFGASGEVVIPYEDKFAEQTGTDSITGMDLNVVGDLYIGRLSSPPVERVAAYGPPPLELAPPAAIPPTIEDNFGISVGAGKATVRGVINPHFWADTRFFVEYGPEPCATSTCTKVPATPPGVLLTDELVSVPLRADFVLSGLAEGATFHFRFAAESGGGGPAFGPDATFTTGREFKPNPCPNDAFRSDDGKQLPDCRAYEMVSPVDKEGGDVVALCENRCNPASLDQSSVSGDRMSFSSFKAYGEVEGAPFSSQYLAARGASGWESKGISPPQSGPIVFKQALSEVLDTQYKAFDAELENGWLVQPHAPALTAGAASPFLYRRDLDSGSYESLVTAPGLADALYPEVQGVTPDGRCILYKLGFQPAPSTKSPFSVYRSCEGATDLISVRPNGEPSTANSSAGTPGAEVRGRWTSAFNAISDDGSRVFWSESSSGAGALFVRFAALAETAKVSTGSAIFWGASGAGNRVVYSEGGDLFIATVTSPVSISKSKVTSESLGVMGMSEDATRVYFVSKQDLDAGGPAASGDPNLYLRVSAGGAITFIAALADMDASGQLSPINPEPVRRTARVSADGQQVVFMARGSLTGYDNQDANSNEPDAEVYLFDSAAGDLLCVSCNPGGVRPQGKELTTQNQPSGIWAAAQIPTFESQLYGSRVIAAGGKRVFFESFEALSSHDTNEAQDVYQWERPGTGECTEDATNFQVSSGGCLTLISSGTGSFDSSFVDAGADGDDVFFTTDVSLVSQDSGLIDIYDARVGGGFPAVVPGPECVEEACQGPLPTPASPPTLPSLSPGPGNPPLAKGKRCPKGKHKVKQKGKVKCVPNKKKKKGQKSRQKTAERAGLAGGAAR